MTDSYEQQIEKLISAHTSKIKCVECQQWRPTEGSQRAVKTVNGKDFWGRICKKCDAKDRYQMEGFGWKHMLTFITIIFNEKKER